MIIAPNAERHTFSNSSLHANSPGSFYSSGSFDARNKFMTYDHGYCFGTGKPWQTVFGEMLEQLQFPDGGGITINHPVWSKLSFGQVCAMLDFDRRVLGIEVYNDTCEVSTTTPQRGWATALWDQLLDTGRKCFGFFVPDHTLEKGRNILLVPEFTEHACLQAYRKGAFYGAINGTGLAFTRILLKNNGLEVEVSHPSTIRMISDMRTVTKSDVRSTRFSINVDDPDRPAMKYARVEAEDGSGERIFSQPIRFTL